MPRKELNVLLILATINLSNIVDFMIIMPLGDQLMRYFQIGPQAFSFLVSAYTLSAFVSGLLGTMWLDRVDRKTALLWLYIGFLVGTAGCAVAPSYLSLLFARVFTGAFGGIMGSLIFAIVGDVTPIERRGKAMGIVTAAFSIASIVGVPLGLFLASLYSWHAPFMLLVVLGLPILVLLYTQFPSLNAHLQQAGFQEHPLQGFKNAWTSPLQRNALMFMFSMILGHFMVVPFIAPAMIANVGLTEQEISYIYLVGGLASVVSSPIIGSMSDRYGKPLIFTIFLFLSIIPMLIITNLTTAPLYVVLILAAVFFVISGGRFVPAQAFVTGVVAPHERGRFMSLLSAVQHLGTSLATMVAGTILTKDAAGHLEHFPIVGLLAAALFLVTYFLFRRIKPDSLALSPVDLPT